MEQAEGDVADPLRYFWSGRQAELAISHVRLSARVSNENSEMVRPRNTKFGIKIKDFLYLHADKVYFNFSNHGRK